MVGQHRPISFGSRLQNETPVSLFTVGYEEQKHTVRPDGFPVDQFLFSRSGKGTLDFYEAGTFSLGSDEWLLVPRGVPHEYSRKAGSQEPWEVGYISLTGKNVKLLIEHFEFEYLKVMKLRYSEKIWDTLDSLWVQTVRGEKEMEWTIAETIYAFLLQLRRVSFWQSDLLTNKNELNSAQLTVMQAASIIREQFADQLLLSQLAISLGYTHQHLNALFHRNFGMSMHQYLQKVRFEASLPFLRNSNLSIEEVARSVGLEVGSYIRLFKQKALSTPGRWRKANE